MDVTESVVVVTGGASGIGRAMAQRFAADGAAHVVVVDMNGDGAAEVAHEIGGAIHGHSSEMVDVSDEVALTEVIDRIEAESGPIDLWCGNAGVSANGGLELDNDVWNFNWNVNVMAHVMAARLLVPRWIKRGGGHLLLTASAAGLITNLGTAPYAVTKHACVALAEWIKITYGEQGVGVSCLCPQGVRTPMTEGDDMLAIEVVKAMGMIEPEEVADCVAVGLANNDFLILPHPMVATYEMRRAGDRERWLSGMQKLQATLQS